MQQSCREQKTGAGTPIYFIYDSGGKLWGFKYSGDTYFYVRNAQGDIIKIADSSGSIVASYTYDAWGNLTTISGYVIGALNPFRYRGYYYDTETGLYYLNARYYNPHWGRFINADSLMGQTGKLLSHNGFAYCMNNPVLFVDPSGRDFTAYCTMTTDSGRESKEWLPIVIGTSPIHNLPSNSRTPIYDNFGNIKTWRWSDFNGDADYDIDLFGQDDHGVGFPHQHDFDHSNKKDPRGKAHRPNKPLPPENDNSSKLQIPELQIPEIEPEEAFVIITFGGAFAAFAFYGGGGRMMPAFR